MTRPPCSAQTGPALLRTAAACYGTHRLALCWSQAEASKQGTACVGMLGLLTWLGCYPLINVHMHVADHLNSAPVILSTFITSLRTVWFSLDVNPKPCA